MYWEECCGFFSTLILLYIIIIYKQFINILWQVLNMDKVGDNIVSNKCLFKNK